MRRLIRDLPIETNGVADCGCRVEVWRKEKSCGRVYAWIKVQMTCTGSRCIMRSPKSPWGPPNPERIGLDGLTRRAVAGDIWIDIDPLARALEDAFDYD